MPALVACALAASPAAAASSNGGASPDGPPTVLRIECRTSCSGSAARIGSLVRLHGTALTGTVRVVFLGGRGPADDVTTPAYRARSARVDLRVPPRAASGPVAVVSADGTESAASAVPALVALPTPPAGMLPAPAMTPAPPPAPAHGAYVDAQLSTSQLVFDAGRPAQLQYVARGTQALTLSIDLVHLPDGLPVAHWGPVSAAAGTPGVVTWDGTAAGRVPQAGRYAFRIFVVAPGESASAAQSAAPDVMQPLDFVPTIFPIRGPHAFGEGIARFGAIRAGHIHQGQDVFANCGVPLVAARGGVVKFAAFQSRAGNYIVIDPDGTGQDMVYMHLRDPALFRRGDHVQTGQQIGFVGRTGDATACHLHFELWTAPGWYTGGHPIDPLPSLLAWDGRATAARR